MRALCTAAAVTLALAGCSGPGPCRLSGGAVGPRDIGGIEGQPKTVAVGLGVARTTGDCSHTRVDSVIATVFDPQNAPVQSSVELMSPSDLVNAAARVTFTPVLPGPYHVSVRFQPDLGTKQTDVTVAIDRSDAGAHEAPVLPGCTQFGLANGQPLCFAPDAGKLRSIGPGIALGEVDAARYSVDEAGRVWTVTERNASWYLHAYTLDGGAFDTAGQDAGGIIGVPHGLIARGGRAAVLDQGGLHLARLESDGGIEVFAFHPFPNSLVGSWCMQLVPPDQLAFVDFTATTACFLADGGLTCEPLPRAITGFFNPGGVDDDGMWWSDLSKLQRWSATSDGDAGQVVAFSSSLSFVQPDCATSEASPVSGDLGLIPRMSPGGIVFEKYPTPAMAIHATSRFVVANDHGTWRWWDR